MKDLTEYIGPQEIISRDRWNKIYKNSIDLSIDRTLPQIIEIYKDNDVKNILDLGCGAGRHLIYLGKMGFDVYGIDISDIGVSYAKHLLKENNLSGEVIVGSIYKRLPYRDNYFDGITCIRSLNHHTIEHIEKTIEEMERVLEPNGLIYVTMRKEVPKEKRLPALEIAPRTYIPLKGKEEGVIHYLFTEEILREKFSNFEILRLWAESGPKDWEAYYCLLGKLKNENN